MKLAIVNKKPEGFISHISATFLHRVVTTHKNTVMFFLIVLLGACSSISSHRDPLMSGLLLAEPESISTRAQLAIPYYTNMLYQAKLNASERSEYLFQRGVAYDAMGLSSLARMDYAEAIKLNPSLAEAHNSIGVHYIQAGMYVLAYEAFDSTLEIDPSYDYALLNRGIALYYGGRKQLASLDTLAFFEKDTSDPIRALWHFITISDNTDDNNAVAKNELQQARLSMNDDDWSTSIIDFYLGVIPESGVVARMVKDVRSQTELNNRLCEAYFYLGKYHATNGNSTKAENYFKLALSTNVYEYYEHKYARIELSNLRRSRRAAKTDSQ